MAPITKQFFGHVIIFFVPQLMLQVLQ